MKTIMNHSGVALSGAARGASARARKLARGGVCAPKGKWLRSLVMIWAVGLCGGMMGEQKSDEVYYTVTAYVLPDGAKLEASGLAMMPGGKLAVAVRKGE